MDGMLLFDAYLLRIQETSEDGSSFAESCVA